MKIALITPTYLPARRANTIQVMKMAQAFTNLGHQVRVIVPGMASIGQKEELHWEQLAFQYGLQSVFEVTWLPVRAHMRRYDFGYLAVSAARKWEADLVYTRLPQAAVIAAWKRMETIYEIHDIPQGTVGPLLFRSYLKAPGACRMVTLTQALKDEILQIYGFPGSPESMLVALDGVDLVRYRDIPNPVEARRLLNADCNLNMDEERFTIGYTGHLYSGRGVALMLEMAERLPGLTFILVGGEREDVTNLRLSVESRNLKNIILTGFVPNAALHRYQAACDVLLMPYQRKVAGSSGGDISKYLSPMKLFEYMACGRPILSSDLPVFREVLNERNSILITPDDIDGWVDNIEELRSDPDTRTELANQAKMDVKQYTWKARAERILSGLA
ncbi:MAG: glycosyltransferase family 4 protein [Anaerolineales bacterium]|nr:glycosyltransferase family 4 protein [Anaerolineales bacterium]